MISYRKCDWLDLSSSQVKFGIQAKSPKLFNDKDWHHCICPPGNVIYFHTEPARDNEIKRLRSAQGPHKKRPK